MIRLYGFFTQNSMKTLYVLEEVGVDFEFQMVDLGKGEQRSDAFAAKTPIRKVPLLEHNGEFLFESGAICRYVANVSDSPLYPVDKMQRARVDQWMDFFSCHLGRWLTKLYFERIIKPKFKLGDPDEAGIAEAEKFVAQQLAIIDAELSTADWLVGDALTIADLFAFAYVEQQKDINLSLVEFPNVKSWLERIDAREAVTRARARVGLS